MRILAVVVVPLAACSTVRAPDPSACKRKGGETVIEVPLQLARITATFKNPDDLKPELAVVMDDLLSGEATKAAVETIAACTGLPAAAVEQHTRLVHGYFHAFGLEWGPHLTGSDWRYKLTRPQVRLVYAHNRNKPAALDESDFGRFPKDGRRPAELLFVAPVICRADSGWNPKKLVARDLPRAPVKILVGNATRRALHPRLSWVSVTEPNKGQPAFHEMDLPPSRQVDTVVYANKQTDPVWGVQSNYLSRPEALPVEAEPWRVTVEDASCGRAVIEVHPPLPPG